MDLNLLLLTLVALTVFLGASQLAVLFLFTRIVGDLKKDHTKNDEFMGGAKNQANEIVQKAMGEAEKIVSDAQSSGLKLISEEKLSSQQFLDKYAEGLKNLEQMFKDQIGQSATKADQSFSQLTSELEKAIAEHMKENERVFAEKTGAMVSKTQGLLDNFTHEIQEKVKVQVEAEMAAAKKEIAEYKARRLSVIDERIIDILEQVLRVALAKKLTLADQSEFVYKSLEEAKREHAFAT